MQVCEHMCPGLSADMLQCAASVFERQIKEGERKREREREWKVEEGGTRTERKC